MSRILPTIAILSTTCVLALGCSDKKDGSSGESSAKVASKAPAGPLSIEKFGLKADAPAGAKVTKAIVGDGVNIEGAEMVVDVSLAEGDDAKTIAEQKDSDELYGPENIKEEKLADGFVVSFENTGAMGRNYFVNSRREIGGKAYTCGALASSPKERDEVVGVCKSLRQ